jgi:hypothetical protein
VTAKRFYWLFLNIFHKKGAPLTRTAPVSGSFSTEGVRNILAFPFKDPKAANKLALLFAFTFGGSFIPIVPTLFMCGYLMEIMRGVIRGSGEPELPEWNDWGRLALDGVKYLGAALIYLAPVYILYFIGFGTYMAGSMLGPLMMSGNRSDMGPFMVTMFGGMAVFFICLFLAMAFALLAGIVLPLALANLAAQDRFSAAFAFGPMWRNFKANLGGYLVSYIVALGIGTVMMIGIQMLYLTVLLCFLIPVLAAAIATYLGPVCAALISRAYREGQDRLNEKVLDVVPAETEA